MLNGLTQLNVELTSRCDRHTLCAFCGHQDPAIHPTLRFGDMEMTMVYRLAMEVRDLQRSVVVQFHRDGDPLAVQDTFLQIALQYFQANIRSVVTHGEQLAVKGWALIDNCESVTVSIFRGDPDRDRQVASVRGFLALKGDKLPRVFLKIVGDMSDDDFAPYHDLALPVLRRLIHTPASNAKYARALPAMPEHGLCLDLLHHPSVAWDGRVYLCNRLDTKDAGLIGNLHEKSLDTIWNGLVRADYVQSHLEGRRQDVPPCKDCQYYGIPTS